MYYDNTYTCIINTCKNKMLNQISDFQAVLIYPNKKSLKRLREVLNNLYQHLDSSVGSGSKYADVIFVMHFLNWEIYAIMLIFIIFRQWICQVLCLVKVNTSPMYIIRWTLIWSSSQKFKIQLHQDIIYQESFQIIIINTVVLNIRIFLD